MGALQVSTDIIINQPILEVAGYAADPDNASVWYDNIKSAVWISEPPLQLGSQLHLLLNSWDELDLYL